MRVERIGSRQYAFGMAWADSGSAKPRPAEVKALQAKLDPGRQARYYHCVVAANGRYALGGGVVASKPGGKIYSYAATLAAVAGDGIYVAPVDDTQLWFCVIREGIVTPETDVIDESSRVLASIDGYRSLLDFDASHIFSAEGVSIRGGAEPFDPIEVVSHVRKPIVLRASGGKVSMAPVVVAAALVIASVVGYKIYVAHQAAVQHKIVTEQQRQQVIQSYRSAAQSALSAYPVDADWPNGAWRTIATRLPVFLAGWNLKDVSCVLSGCDANYVRTGKSFSAVSPFTDRFGVAAVGFDPKGNLIKVHLPLNNRAVEVNDDLLHNPPAAGMPILDWMGLSTLHVDGLQGQPTVVATNLAAVSNATQVGYPAFVTDTVTLKGSASVANSIRDAVQWGMYGSFRVTKFEFSVNSGKGGSNWTFTLARFHG